MGRSCAKPAPSNLLEFTLKNIIAALALLAVFGASHAAEIADAPIPEPNYVGIIVFLILMIGAGVWFFWKIMRNKDGDAK